MKTGEIHYVWGEPYCINIHEHYGLPRVWTDNQILEMRIRPGTGRDKRISILEDWYRQQLKQQIPPLISLWEPLIGVSIGEWGVKKMKTRWGSCNIKAGRIWLNLELAKKPQKCLEYIVVHEMTHLLERYHNGRFKKLMDTFMPDWRIYKDILNRTYIRD